MSDRGPAFNLRGTIFCLAAQNSIEYLKMEKRRFELLEDSKSSRA